MKSTLTFQSVLIGVTLAALLAFSLVCLTNQPHVAQASVTAGNEYQSTTTSATSVSGATISQLKSGYSALGSVVITTVSSTTVAAFTVYDATSTMATSSAKVLAKFQYSQAAAGTYTFDSAARYGVSVEVPVGFTGNYTVTYR